MGQKIWGPKNDDQIYISSFYGPKWDVPEVMKIDVMAFNGVTIHSFLLNSCEVSCRVIRLRIL